MAQLEEMRKAYNLLQEQDRHGCQYWLQRDSEGKIGKSENRKIRKFAAFAKHSPKHHNIGNISSHRFPSMVLMLQAAQSEQALADADAERLRLGVVRTPKGVSLQRNFVKILIESSKASSSSHHPKLLPSIATLKAQRVSLFLNRPGSDSFHGSLTHIQARTLETTWNFLEKRISVISRYFKNHLALSVSVVALWLRWGAQQQQSSSG